MMVTNHPPSILVADDEQSNLLQLEGALQTHDHVLTAPTGQTASYMLETAEPETDGFHGDHRWRANAEDIFGVHDSFHEAGNLSAEQLEITRQILLSSFK